ncbi:hypothetical protein QE152_g15836 [Popillia japonica]|uniref:Uncharacterized protein n=1 Tax=Popillia japonica TaxID=7064 RepID=A0AAW1L805_POPJA
MHAQVKGPHFGLVRESLAFTSRRSIKPQGPSLGSLRFYAGIRRTTYETTPSAEPIGITPHAAVRNPRNSSKIADKPQWVQLREKDVLAAKKELEALRKGDRQQQIVTQIKDRLGMVLTEKNRVMEKWKEYFEDLLNVENNREVTQWLPEEEESTENQELGKEEAKEAMKKLKSGKSADVDQISGEM